MSVGQVSNDLSCCLHIIFDKHDSLDSLQNYLFDETKQETISNLKGDLKLLDSMCVRQSVITEITNEPESLLETKRKKHIREGLTNITDPMFQFFLLLETKCRDFLTPTNLSECREYLFASLFNNVMTNKELLSYWLKLFNCDKVMNTSSFSQSNSAEEIASDICTEVLKFTETVLSLRHKVVQTFLKVVISQFRRDFLSYKKIQKSKTLRKKVMAKKIKCNKTLDFKFIIDDTSKKKNASHYRLKSEVVQNRQFFSNCNFNKQQLQLLAKAYGVHFLSKANKSNIAMLLSDAILNSDHTFIPMYEVLTTCASQSNPVFVGNQEPLPSTSRQHSDNLKTRHTISKPTSSITKAKGKKRKVSKKSNSLSTCTSCDLPYVESDDWICCDVCLSWFHRCCAGLDDDDVWRHYSEHDVPFMCPLCT
ncbi:uncharacterized protein LOC121390864 [Gigantopelta aegis]|uniref:uncharacterized protein LOC121390864 n=1 Tax=Gigantopelta aegis TaxID=1735272 RepID=UPI001B88C535|nr:uncharacterized protein LOC121390864 [Gigantopelta aegis]